MNILAVIAHPDDEILGCGATLRKLADAKHDIYSCVLCSLADARHKRPDLKKFKAIVKKSETVIGIKDTIRYKFKNIQFNVVPQLDIVKAIESAIIKFRPEWVFTHHPADINIDHRICYEAAMVAIRLPQRFNRAIPPTMIKKVFLFEVMSATDWNPPVEPSFQPNCFFDIENTFDYKIRALECYSNVLKPVPHPRSSANIRNLASLRGSQAGVHMAEAFCLVRDLHL